MSSRPAPSLPSGGAGLVGLLVALGLYDANTLLRGERWCFILLRSDAPTRRRDAYGRTTVGYVGCRSGRLASCVSLGHSPGGQKGLFSRSEW